jgi:hypothetical protein
MGAWLLALSISSMGVGTITALLVLRGTQRRQEQTINKILARLDAMGAVGRNNG